MSIKAFLKENGMGARGCLTIESSHIINNNSNNNNNNTEWSTIQGVIGRVISNRPSALSALYSTSKLDAEKNPFKYN